MENVTSPIWKLIRNLRNDYFELGNFKFGKNERTFESFKTFVDRDLEKRCSRLLRNIEKKQICECGSNLDFINSKKCEKCEGLGFIINLKNLEDKL